MNEIEEKRLIQYDNIKPQYYIYKNGEIFSVVLNHFLKGNIDSYGYKRVHLQKRDGTEKMYKVHRLVKIVFDPIDDFEFLTVDHLDGNKLNNNLSNLEWCTDGENVKRAYKNKLIYKSHRKMNEEEIIKICEYLSLGYSPKMIAQKLYPDDITHYQNVIQDIFSHRHWTEFSCNYTFWTKYPNFQSKKWTIWQIEQVCKLIQDTNKTNIQISLEVFNSSNKNDIMMVKMIRQHKKYTVVSKYYNF